MIWQRNRFFMLVSNIQTVFHLVQFACYLSVSIMLLCFLSCNQEAHVRSWVILYTSIRRYNHTQIAKHSTKTCNRSLFIHRYVAMGLKLYCVCTVYVCLAHVQTKFHINKIRLNMKISQNLFNENFCQRKYFTASLYYYELFYKQD